MKGLAFIGVSSGVCLLLLWGTEKHSFNCCLISTLQTFGTEKWLINVIKHTLSKVKSFLGNWWKWTETGCSCLLQHWCFCQGFSKCTYICLGFCSVVCTLRDMSLLLQVGWEWRAGSDCFFWVFTGVTNTSLGWTDLLGPLQVGMLECLVAKTWNIYDLFVHSAEGLWG